MEKNILTYAFAALIITVPSLATANKNPSIKWIDCATNVPEPLKDIEMPLSLPSTLQCGRLDVPMDYSKPIAPNNTITLGFSINRPQNPQGLINL